jgi:uncharacterized protein (DUF2384 family)
MASTASTALLRSLSVPVLARVTGAHPRTVERWRAGSGIRRRRFRIRLANLAAVLATLGPRRSPERQRAWLLSPSAHLDGRRPIDALAEGDVARTRAAASLEADQAGAG